MPQQANLDAIVEAPPPQNEQQLWSWGSSIIMASLCQIWPQSSILSTAYCRRVSSGSEQASVRKHSNWQRILWHLPKCWPILTLLCLWC